MIGSLFELKRPLIKIKYVIINGSYSDSDSEEVNLLRIRVKCAVGSCSGSGIGENGLASAAMAPSLALDLCRQESFAQL